MQKRTRIKLLLPPCSPLVLQQKNASGEASGTTSTSIATEPEDGIPINPPIDDEEDDRPPPPLNSMIEVDVEGTGVFYCSVDEHEDDGAVFLHTQDGERMNIFLDDDGISWRRAWERGDCSKRGHKMLSCDHCKVLRPRGVLEATGGAGDGDD